MTEPTAIAAVRASTIQLRLRRPIYLGDLVIREREYCLAEVVSHDGLTGKSYCLTRGSPIDRLVHEVVGPAAVGTDAAGPASPGSRLLQEPASNVPALRKAIALVDTAVWDVAAQRNGVPLWRYLGNDGLPRRTALIAAYIGPADTPEEVASALSAAMRSGWRTVKVSRSPDPSFMRCLFTALNPAWPPDAQLVVDANYAWRTAAEAVAEVELWQAPPLGWLEDPLPTHATAEYQSLKRALPVPLGAGDEVADPADLLALIEADAIDTVRIDPMALGGITPARDIAAVARAAGKHVSCHYYPEVGVHLGADIEIFPAAENATLYDPITEYVAGGPGYAPGWAFPPAGAGLGFELPSAHPQLTGRHGG